MTPIEIAAIVFLCVCVSAQLGMSLRGVTPNHHLCPDSKDVIKLGMGLVATLTALVLGLVIATAKGTYDTQLAAVKHTAAKVLLIDRVLSHYGPETKEIRDRIRQTVADRFHAIWPEDHSQPVRMDTPEAVAVNQGIEIRILQLEPQNNIQRWLQSQAMQIISDIMETRWLVMGDRGSSVPLPFLVVVVIWLTILFGSFGLLAPRNLTVTAVLFLSALSVAASIFLILEMDQPFEGLIKISGEPMRYALSHLGQ